MELFIAGINHNDFLGRKKLASWLAILSEENADSPAFVATEWDEEIFKQVKEQRGTFRSLVKTEWPNASRDLLDTFALGLAYEADTHLEFFPDAKIVWLEHERESPIPISEYAKRRFMMLKSWLGGAGMPDNDSEALDQLSACAHQEATHSQQGDERDAKFAELVAVAVEELSQSDWAIAIVGSNHASSGPDTFRTLLENSGVTCKVSLL